MLACRPGPEVHSLLTGKEGDVDGATLKRLLRELGRAGAGRASIEVLHWAFAREVVLEPIHFNTAIMTWCARCPKSGAGRASLGSNWALGTFPFSLLEY